MKIRDFILVFVLINFVFMPSLNTWGSGDKVSITITEEERSEKNQNLNEDKPIFKLINKETNYSFNFSELGNKIKFILSDDIIEDNNYSDIIIPPPDFMI